MMVREKTPLAVFLNLKPFIYFRAFVCLAYVPNPESKNTKSDSKSKKIGINRFWNPRKDQIATNEELVTDEDFAKNDEDEW